MDRDDTQPVTLGPADPAPYTATSNDEALARRLYEEELKFISKLENDEEIAREIQAQEDRKVAKLLGKVEQDDEATQGLLLPAISQ